MTTADKTYTPSKENVSDIKDLQQAEIIGVDESGKGDYFGSLVIAAVYVPNTLASAWLQGHGITDSKKLSDTAILEKARIITDRCQFHIITISPAKYNELYEKMKNLNEILAWGHATAIETLLQKVSCNCAICDQFSANEDQIRKHLKAKGRSIILHQRHKAESHIAVAAASILARRSFIFSLKHFEDKYHVYLPKGAGKVTEQMASKFIEKYGKEKLSEVAKIHFKNTERVNGYK